MAECVRTPTRTTSVPFVTNSVFPTTFTSASTLPDTFVTTAFFTDICTFNATLNEDVCNEVRTTVVSTILGEITSVRVTEITTIPVTTLVPTTLFGTSCPPDVTPTPDPETPTPTPIPDPPTSEPSSSSRITSPGSSSRTSSGYTSRTSGSSSLPPTSSLPADDGTETTNIAPIVGGAVGGVVGLLVLGVLAWFFFKKVAFGKNSKFDSIFNKTDGMDHIHPEKPIMNFGMQGGQQVMQNMAQNQAPANNNGANHTQQQNQGQPTGHQGQGQQGYQNGYQPQGQDGYQTGYQHGDPTGGIDQTLNNGGEYQPQGNEQDGPELDDIKRKQLQRLFKAVEDEQGQVPQMPSNMPLPRPLSNGGIPAVAPFVVNQVYPPQQPQFSNPPVTGYHPHHAQPGYYPQAAPSTLSHNPSVGGSSGYYGSQYGSPHQPVVGLPPNNQAHGHSHAPSTSSYGRTGSPIPVQNTQVLQVVNPEASYQYNHGHSASASGSSYPAGSSAAATPAYPTDGKGRPVNTGGEKAPIVHLDGGRYEEPAPSTSGTTHPPSGPPPPMYSS